MKMYLQKVMSRKTFLFKQFYVAVLEVVDEMIRLDLTCWIPIRIETTTPRTTQRKMLCFGIRFRYHLPGNDSATMEAENAIVIWKDGSSNFGRYDAIFFEELRKSPNLSNILKDFILTGSDQWKMRGVGKLASVRRWFRTVAIDVCLLFNIAVVFSSKYFRFLLVNHSL